MTYRPLVRPARTAAILGTNSVRRVLIIRAFNEFDDNNEMLMVDGVWDDPVIRMRIACPEMQCELHLI